MSETGKRLRSAHVVATMVRLREFTALDLAAHLEIDVNGARRWVVEFSEHKLLQPVGSVKSGRSGHRSVIWRWQA